MTTKTRTLLATKPTITDSTPLEDMPYNPCESSTTRKPLWGITIVNKVTATENEIVLPINGKEITFSSVETEKGLLFSMDCLRDILGRGSRVLTPKGFQKSRWFWKRDSTITLQVGKGVYCDKYTALSYASYLNPEAKHEIMNYEIATGDFGK